MNEGLSAADVMAICNGNRNAMDEMWSNPFVYLVWMALFGGGGFGFGGNGLQGTLTRSDMFEGFNTQEINNQLRGITSGLCDGFYAVNSGMKDGFYATREGLAENRFASQQCCCETNRNIDAVRAENYKNTCEITNAIHAEGEATRALINANTMQELRDRLEATRGEVMVRDFQLSQLSQTSNIVNTLRPTPIPAYITCSPYTTTSNYNYSGCGCV